MATSKKTKETKVEVAPEAEVKSEVTAETVVEGTPKKKTTAKKTTAKKTATTTKATAKKTAKKPVEPTVEFFVEYNGAQESYATIVENIKKSYLANNENAEISSIKVYLKPTDNKAYCVINDDIQHEVDIYFC